MRFKRRPVFLLGCLTIIAFTALVVWGTKKAIERFGSKAAPDGILVYGVSQKGADKYCKQVFPILKLESRETGRVYVVGTVANGGDRTLSHVYVRVKYLTTRRGKIKECTIDLGQVGPSATRNVLRRLTGVRDEDVVVPGGITDVEVYRVIFGKEE